MLRDAIIALSLANLCFFSVWGELLPGSPVHYFMESPPSRSAFMAVFLNVLLLALGFWSASNLAKRFASERQRGFAQLAFLGVVVVALNGVRRSVAIVPAGEMSELFRHSGFIALMVMTSAVAGIAAIRWRKWLTRAAKIVVLILSPVVVLTFGEALRSLWNYEAMAREFTTPVMASRLPAGQKTSPRVVWLLFDELDQQLAFDERPAGLRLPELDRLRAQVVYATQAYPVAGETGLAMPALVMGMRVAKVEPIDFSKLRVTLADGRGTLEWSAQPNIFTAARAAGFNTAVVGFFHPYCRVLQGSLTRCSWRSSYFFRGAWRHSPVFTMPEIMVNQISAVLSAIPAADLFGLPQSFLARFADIQAKRQELVLQQYFGVFEEAKKVVADQNLGLVLVHLPVPHPPFIYDRFKGQFVANKVRSYLDNLVLADRTLGELRRVMEDAGVWESSAVLVTSDHWYRGKRTKSWLLQGENFSLSTYTDHRVPLLLKLPGQQRGSTYEAPFNTIIIHDLILALLSKSSEMSEPAAVVKWIDDHRTVAPPLCDEVQNVNHVCSTD